MLDDLHHKKSVRVRTLFPEHNTATLADSYWDPHVATDGETRRQKEGRSIWNAPSKWLRGTVKYLEICLQIRRKKNHLECWCEDFELCPSSLCPYLLLCVHLPLYNKWLSQGWKASFHSTRAQTLEADDPQRTRHREYNPHLPNWCFCKKQAS